MARISRKTNTIIHQEPISIAEYQVAIYVRLSVEDIRKKPSDSIATQKAMLLSYVEKSDNFHVFDIYEDVNYTGTNFERPAFNRMMNDIKSGKVNCVIVKDLSRFGRNFLEAGNYLERVFPFMQVRFISVNDGYDSSVSSSEETGLLMPLKNLINEAYSRDISKKVRSSYKIKQKNGDFCGSFAPYGYIKEGNTLVIDPETAPIVQKIFNWIIEGKSDITITGDLNSLGIVSPSRYRFEKGITKSKKYENAKFWYKSAIKRISENPTYLGSMIGNKFSSAPLKNISSKKSDSKNWIIVENTHEPIIDKATFEAVQKIRMERGKKYNSKLKEDTTTESKIKENATTKNIFKGLIICADCGSHMIRHKLVRANGNVDYVFLCNVYEQVDKNACSKKSISETFINNVIYNVVSHQIKLAVSIKNIINEISNQNNFKYKSKYFDNKLTEINKKIARVRQFILSLKEDYYDKVINEEEYEYLKFSYETEIANLKQELENVQSEKYRYSANLSIENVWLKEFSAFENQKKLSANMVRNLIERIEVADNERISITFRFREEFEAIFNNYYKQLNERRTING